MARQKELIEITPEIKSMLKKNYFFINKAKFPSYFAGNILMAYFFIGLAIFIVFYFQKVFMTFLIVFALVIVAFIYTFRWLSPYRAEKQTYSQRPTTDQMENWLIQDIKEIVKPMAVEMLSLNPATITSDNFIVVPCPVYWSESGVPDENITKYYADSYNVYSTYKIHVLALSENYVSFYTCVFNWLDNEIVSPFTLEFFFDDISSITNESQNLDLVKIDAPAPEKKEDDEEEEVDDSKNKIGAAQTVVVKNKSGESMNIIVNIPELEASPRSTLKPEKVMQTLRIMLRHRRYGEEFEIVRPKEEESEKSEESEE